MQYLIEIKKSCLISKNVQNMCIGLSVDVDLLQNMNKFQQNVFRMFSLNIFFAKYDTAMGLGHKFSQH